MFVFIMCSIFFELAAQFDRLVTISKVFRNFNKISYKSVCISIITTITVFYIFKLYEYNIKSFEGDNNLDFSSVSSSSGSGSESGSGGSLSSNIDYFIHSSNDNTKNVSSSSSESNTDSDSSGSPITFYYLFKSNFSSTKLFIHMDLAHSIIRDFICVFILLAVDILILIEFRKIMRHKKKILNRRNDIEISMNQTSTAFPNLITSAPGINSTSSVNSTNTAIEQAENRTTLMVLVIGLSTFFGRLPMFFVYMPFREFHLKICYQVISETLFLTNITWNFFIYYFFNKSFKLVFHSYLFKIRDYCRDSDHHTNNNRHNLHQNLTTTNINLTTDRLPLSNSKEAVL